MLRSCDWQMRPCRWTRSSGVWWTNYVLRNEVLEMLVRFLRREE